MVGGRETFRHAPNRLAGWQVANVATGAAARKVTPVVGIAAEGLPRDFFVVQCQDVVVGAKIWRPCWSDRGLGDWHGSTTHTPDTSRVDWWASEHMRCHYGDRHVAIRGR